MRLKQRIPTYIVGQTVTILDNLENRTTDNVSDAGIGDFGLINPMSSYQGRLAYIQSIDINGFYRIDLDRRSWSWSPNMFKESYDFEHVLLNPLPEYHVGQIVIITDTSNLRLGRDFHGLTVTDTMVRKAGNPARIMTVRPSVRGNIMLYTLQFLGDISPESHSWSASCFVQSYSTENLVAQIDEELNKQSKNKEMKEDFSIDDLKEGMYIFHDSYCSGNNRHILAMIAKIDGDRLHLRYIHKSNIRDYQMQHNLNSIDEEEIIKILHSGYSSSLTYTASFYKRGNIQFIADDIFIPNDEELKLLFNLSNEKFFKEDLKEGMLPTPDLFKESKFKLKKVDILTKTERLKDAFAFHIKNNIYVQNVSFGKYKTIKSDKTTKAITITKKDYKDILVKFSAVKITNFEDSAMIFGHKTRKEAMFKSLKADGKSKNIFKIHNVIFNYEKKGKFYHVLEINDGTLNLKFILSDLKLLLPNVNNYVLPKEREIKTETFCKVTRDKLLPVKKGEKVKVVKMFNRHVPVKGTYDKNTICIVVDNNNKQFECKAHQLKRV